MFRETHDELAETSDITSERIYANLESCRSVTQLDGIGTGKLDILVRTSNVKRLSDFMMWQVSSKALHPAIPNKLTR
jgi:undecaprenyl diphosphate synthase